MTVCGSLATSVILGDSYGIHHHTATEMIILMTDISVIWHSMGKKCQTNGKHN